MPWQPQGLERIREWKGRIGGLPLVAIGGLPLVAIGGLTLERLAGVFAAGADVAAVVSDILRDRNPEARTREWLAAARAA
jgi:thiamine-phosphate pyrophosphorylase